MPLIRCHHCGEDTFSIEGWADLDHCAYCGRPLGERRIALGAALQAKGRFADRGRTSPAEAPTAQRADKAEMPLQRRRR